MVLVLSRILTDQMNSLTTSLTTEKEQSIATTLKTLWEYSEKQNWAGYDPYDALNSRLFARTPFSRSGICRIAATQILKRLPVNLRPLLLISKEQNPKALSLFLSASLKLGEQGLLKNKEVIGLLIDRIIALRSPDTAYWCWGYSFPWQTRTVLVPKGAPNLVCTTFVSNALLDVYEQRREERCLSMAISAGEYILNELYWTDGESVAGFSYPLPGLQARVHNANFLAASLFARIHNHSGDRKFLEPALKAARYSARRQHEDGSWDYGERFTQRWVDNFHTGYNLCALRSMGRALGSSEFEPFVQRGFKFYRANFFTEDSAPKYFHNRVYPIDIHSVAQSIITLITLHDLDEGNLCLALSISDWAMRNLWNKKGYFFYQKTSWLTNRLSYMRWSQAWMLLSLATLLETLPDARKKFAGPSDCQRKISSRAAV